jgi:ferredoxin
VPLYSFLKDGMCLRLKKSEENISESEDERVVARNAIYCLTLGRCGTCFLRVWTGLVSQSEGTTRPKPVDKRYRLFLEQIVLQDSVMMLETVGNIYI